MPRIVPGSAQTMLDSRYLFKEQMELPSYLLQIKYFSLIFSTPHLSLVWLSFRESTSSWEDIFFWVVSHSGFYTQIKAAILDQSMSQRHLSCLRATLGTSLLQEPLKIYLIVIVEDYVVPTDLTGLQWSVGSLYLDDLAARWEIKLKAYGLVNPTDSRIVLVQW